MMVRIAELEVEPRFLRPIWPSSRRRQPLHAPFDRRPGLGHHVARALAEREAARERGAVVSTVEIQITARGRVVQLLIFALIGAAVAGAFLAARALGLLPAG